MKILHTKRPWVSLKSIKRETAHYTKWCSISVSGLCYCAEDEEEENSDDNLKQKAEYFIHSHHHTSCHHKFTAPSLCKSFSVNELPANVIEQGDILWTRAVVGVQLITFLYIYVVSCLGLKYLLKNDYVWLTTDHLFFIFTFQHVWNINLRRN